MTEALYSAENYILEGYNMLLCFAGAMILHEPDEECIADFWKKGMLKGLPVSSSNPVFLKASEQLKESCFCSSSNATAMRKDFQRLLADDNSLAPVYESSYLTNEMGIIDFYESYGWKPDLRSNMRDDHLSTELLFLSRLIEEYIGFDDEACRREQRLEIKRLINNHLLSWIPQWHDKIQKNALTMCYKGVSSLVYACIQDIYSLLD